MSENPIHPNVAFATKFGDPTGNYLNASTALARMEGLIADAERLVEVLGEVRDKTDRWMPWYSSDIISYYAVGYVTCLEWHARSRIADLAKFKPSLLKSEDLKGQVSDKVMIQLLTEGASVANLISAGISVGSFEKYMIVLNRVLSAIGTGRDAYTIAKEIDPTTGDPWFSSQDFQELEKLFIFRNELVHEIGRGLVGHLNVRETWTPEEAVSAGRRVEKLIRVIEKAITAHAPEDFPNLIDDKGLPIWQFERLKSQIAALEAQIIPLIDRINWLGQDRSKEEWSAALDAAKDHIGREVSFIRGAAFLHSGYIDLTSPLEEKLVQDRHDFLKMLIKHATILVGDYPLDDDSEVAEPPQPIKDA